MTRGGKREGAGRPVLSEDKKAKKVCLYLYPWEKEKVKDFIKILRKNPSIIED